MCNSCFIIPEFILKELLNESEKFAPDNRSDLDKKFRNKRSAALLREGISVTIAKPKPSIVIYDSENTTNQRHKLVMTDGNPASIDGDINNTNVFAGVTRNYFKNELNWNSIDDKGMDMIFNVHLGTNYNNAFWDGDDMSFGDGDKVNFISFTNAVDVIGHELTHGVVQYTAKLIYDAQPGALNEHFADVFGTAIKQFHKGQNENNADWLMGNEIMGPRYKGRAIRSMKAPDDTTVPLRAQPAHMANYYTGSEDNHGVHINSGIPNKAFYLVSMKIGTFKAAKLWFAALQKLKSTSQFIDLYNAISASIPAFINGNIIPENSQTIVDKAFRDVGIIPLT